MIRPQAVTVASSSGPTFDGSQGTSFELTLTQDATAPLFLNFIPGVRYVFDIGQDATGGHTFAWPSTARNMAPVNAAPGVRTTQTAVIRGDGKIYAMGVAALNGGA